MTRQKYSKEEALERILRAWKGVPATDDSPGQLMGTVEPWNISLSDLAEIFQNSLPGFVATLPPGIDLNGPKVYAYLSTGTTTTVTSSGTFTPILGPFVNAPMEYFSVATDKIQYDGENDTIFEILWSATLRGDDGNRTYHVGISINEEVIDVSNLSVLGSFMKSTEPMSLSGVYAVELSKGDTVQLQLTSSADADDVVVVQFTTSIKRL